MKKIIFGALLTLGVITFVGCADKAASNDTAATTTEKPAVAKCGGEKSASKCGGEKKAESKCGGDKEAAAKKLKISLATFYRKLPDLED